jgi:hypothetical protein
MSLKYDRNTDRFLGHDSLSGSYSHGFVDFEITELEIGARAAIALDDPEQWWWEIYHEQITKELNGH